MGQAVVGMRRLCKFYPCSSLGSSVLVNWPVGQIEWVSQAWGVGLGSAVFDKALFPFSDLRPSRKH